MKHDWCIAWLLAWAIPAAAAPPHRVTYRIETVAGSDRRGDGGPATAAQIGNIQGVAVDRAGNIYLSDTDFHRVRKISPAGLISTLAGNGTPGYGGDGGPAGEARLNLPYGLAADAAGYLFIADLGNHRIRRISPDGTITTIAGNGHKGSAGDDGPGIDAQLMSPRNVAMDGAGNLYIAEFEGHRIRRVAPDGRITTVAGTGLASFSGDGFAARAAQIAYPAGLAVDRSGVLYFCDSQNQRVRAVLANGVIVTVLGGAAGTSMLTPTSLAVDSYGSILVGDRSASIRQYSTREGKWTTAAGTGNIGYEGDGGQAGFARLTEVHDIAVDTTGNIFIADAFRIRKVNSAGIISTLAGDGYLHFIGDGGAAAGGTLLAPTGLALDTAGNLFIADTGTERVRRISAGGIISTVAGNGTAGFNLTLPLAFGSPLNSPQGVAIDATGDLLIADTFNHRIRRVTADGRIRTAAGTGIAASGPEGLPPDRENLRGPRGLCTDRTGGFHVVDTANHRVLRVPPGSLVSTSAGNGAPGDGGDGGRAPVAQLNLPSGCAFDPSGNLFIADTASHRLRRVDGFGVITTVAGTGTAGFSGDEGPAAAARLSGPRGVAVGSDGSLFIADTGNNRIRWVDPDGVIHTIAGQDAAGFAGDGGDSVQALLRAPSGVVADAAGNLHFSDTGNHRIRKMTPETVPIPVEVPPEISVNSAAGGKTTALAPGEVLTITGIGLGPETGVTGSLDGAGLVPSWLAEAEVLFDGVPAPLFYVQASQITAQAPYSLNGAVTTTMEARYRRASRGKLAVAVADAAPVIFPGLQNQDGGINSVTKPAARGSVVTLFATGEGMTEGPNVTGLPANPPLFRPRLPVSLRIAGVQAEILFAGTAPGQTGVLQVDVRVPAGFVPPGEMSLELAVGPYAATPVTVWLK